MSSDDIAQAVEAGSVALSLNGLPVLQQDGLIQFLAVKFALGDGTWETVLIDRMPGRYERRCGELGRDGVTAWVNRPPSRRSHCRLEGSLRPLQQVTPDEKIAE